MREDYREKFSKYVERMKEIRLLSTPSLEDIKDADNYSRVLQQNFSKIGELAIENRKLIDEYIKPILASENTLPKETKEPYQCMVEVFWMMNTQ